MDVPSDNFTPEEVFTERFVKNVHKRMYGNVWRWAGQYRKTNKNLEANLPAADTNQLSTNKSQNMQDIKEKTHQTHDRKKHEGSESQGKKEGKQ